MGIILGVDPGTRIAGYSIIKKDQYKTYLLDCGYLSMPASKSLVERVGIFHKFFQEKVEKYLVTDLALETPFLGKNAANFLKLGYMRGILYLVASNNNLVLHEFSPREVKLSVTGFGGASKEQVASIITKLIPTSSGKEKYDVTDAVAVSLCALWKNKYSDILKNKK